MPATLVHQAARAAKINKEPEPQASISTSPVTTSLIKSASSSTATLTNVPPSSSASVATKRTPSKTSVFSKIFK
jgi:hypothetical protein